MGLKRVAAGCFALLISLATQAAIVDHGKYLTDTVSGLDWLKPTSSVGKSYDYVASQFGAGGEFAGWRYATGAEFTGLVSRYSGVNISYDYVEMEPNKIDGLVTLMGSTVDVWYLSQFGVTYNQMYGYPPGSDVYETRGLLADTGVAGVGLVGHWLAEVLDQDIPAYEISNPDYVKVHWAVLGDDNFGGFGSFLVRQTEVLDFESPLPNGLVPMSFWNGTSVPVSARVTDQYLDHGIRIEGAALVKAGLGHAASGTNGLGGIDASGRLNYDSPVTFTFFSPLDGTTPATTDYFGYSPDLAGGSNNVITITAYDLDGLILGQVTYTESGTFPVSTPLSISGFGQFHKITVDQTLYSVSTGGIVIDLVRFGALQYLPPDETPPVITPTITGTLGKGDWYTGPVTVAWSVVDDESDVISSTGCEATPLTNDTAGFALTCSATSEGGTSSSTVTIKIDSTPPAITCGVTPNVIWSPNHKLVNISATVNVIEVLSGSPAFTLVSVTSNEADAGLNKSDVPTDIQGWTLDTADVIGQLRAERSDAGTGRVYTLSYRSVDGAGNIGQCNATVSVPRDQQKK